MSRMRPRAFLTRAVSAPTVPLSEQLHRGHRFVRTYVTVLVLATLVFGALVLAVLLGHDREVLTYVDGPLARALQGVQVPLLSWLLTHTSDLGTSPYNLVCFALVALPLFALRLRLEAVVITVSTLVAGGLVTLFKDLVQRARPTGAEVHVAAYLQSYSFPSGHVVFATVLFGLAFWVFWMSWRPSLLRDGVLLVLAALLVLMGLSRIYLGEHWPSDVLGSYCLAGLWVAGTIELLLVLKPRLNRYWRGRPQRRRVMSLWEQDGRKHTPASAQLPREVPHAPRDSASLREDR